jgi:pimeloyl-ACP methyl ester carboxylesterase
VGRAPGAVCAVVPDGPHRPARRWCLAPAGQAILTQRPVRGAADALGIDRAAPVGVSAGGGLAIDFALERPQRTWALVVVASGPRGIDDVQLDPRVHAFYQAVGAGDLERAAELFIELWAPLQTSPELDARIRRMVAESVGMLQVLPKG